MVLQSPIYKAPSIPKMGKNSSPLSSSSEKIESAVKGPDLKTSKMSFIQGLGISIITAESLKSVEKPVISTNTLKIVEKIILKPEKLKEPDREISGVKPEKLKESDRKVSGVEPEKLKGPDASKVKGSSSINTDLIETNSILVEIQKQLELDFASRIAERKQNLASAKKKIRKKKLVEKEEFVERGKGLSGNIIAFGSKVLSPVKSIFDKILDFLAIVGTGIALNTAWEWLSDEENRKKLLGVLEFLGKNWKLITGILVGGFIAKKLYGLYKIFNGIRKVIKFLRGPKPGLPDGVGKRRTPTNPTNPANCNPILNCLKNAAVVTAIATAVAPTVAKQLLGKTGTSGNFNPGNLVNIFTTGISNIVEALLQTGGALAPLLLPGFSPVRASETPEEATRRVTEEIEGEQSDYSNVSSPLKSFTGKEIPVGLAGVLNELQEKFRKTGETQSALTPQGFLSVSATAPNRANLGGLFGLSGPDMTPKVSFNPKLTPESNKEAIAQATTLFTVANLPATIAPFVGAAKAGQPKVVSPSRRFVTTRRSIDGSADQLARSAQTSVQGQAAKRTVNDQVLDELLRSLVLKGGKPGETILQRGNLTATERLALEGIQPVKRSLGGLIPGMASMMDTIPALLAKGEFVINSMSTKLFKPFLFAINDNAGKMFQNFVQAIKQIKNNVIRDEEISKKESENFKKFGKLVQEMETRELKRKLKDAGTGGTGGGTRKTKGSVKTVTRKTPTKIQTYRRGIGSGSRSGSTLPSSSTTNNEGKITTVNITQPFLNLAGQQTPVEPEVQSEEKASSGITISTTDSSNPYIMNSYVNYGIEV